MEGGRVELGGVGLRWVGWGRRADLPPWFDEASFFDFHDIQGKRQGHYVPW